MKKEHIVDKLLNVAIILSMLVTSIIMYNTVIDLVVEEPYIYEYGCIDYEEADTIEEIEELEKTNCLENDTYVEEQRINYYKRLRRNLFTEIYVLALSVGLLFLLNKKDLTKEGLVTKILNAILILITFGGTIGVGSLLINELFYELEWDNLLRAFGLVLWPIVFYIVLNKYIFIEPKKKKTSKKKTGK
jgi:hypothetical protein